MRIKKTTETTPISSETVNTFSNSTKNAYSCDYVNNAIKDVYSTDEVKTNKVWIDGKPIYKKVYTGTVDIQASTSSKFLFNLPSDYNEVTDYYGKFTWQSFMQTFPMVWGNDACALRKVSDGIHYLSNFGIGSGTYKITIEYTKTTD